MARIKDVAERANVSTTTVSHVLNGTRFVGAERRQRVLRAIAELGFEPNSLARSLRRKETFTIGALVSDVRNPFFTAVLRGIEDVAQRWGYSVVIGNSDENVDKQEQYLRVLSARQIDGLVVAPTGAPSLALRAFLERGVPTVFVDRRPVGIVGAVTVVGVDNGGAAYQAVEHLILDGHTRIGVITGLPNVSTASDRLAGYRLALEAHGLPIDERLVDCGQSSVESGCLSLHRILRANPPPTAIFAINNRMTLGALIAIREAGLRCPEDVAIVGFDDHDWATIAEPPLTVVRQPTYLLGVRAAGLLLQGVQGKPMPQEDALLPVQLVIRGSCSERCARRYRSTTEDTVLPVPRTPVHARQLPVPTRRAERAGPPANDRGMSRD